jgi:hypothetical protein
MSPPEKAPEGVSEEKFNADDNLFRGGNARVSGSVSLSDHALLEKSLCIYNIHVPICMR